MHRTKVRVAEDALDANLTIARANRDDFDRAGVQVVNLMSAPGAGKTSLLEAVFAMGLGDVQAGVLEGDVQGSYDADRLAHFHVPVTQLNTDTGFGGECHLDANMVRSALPSVAARRHRPAGGRERRQPRLPGRVPDRRGRAGDALLGHRGRGQAAEVPADVPHLRARGHQQDRPAAAPGLRRRPAAGEPRHGASGRRAHARQRAHRRGRRRPSATGWCGRRSGRPRPRDRRGRPPGARCRGAHRRAARRCARRPTASTSPPRPSGWRGSATGWPSASRAAAGCSRSARRPRAARTPATSRSSSSIR